VPAPAPRFDRLGPPGRSVPPLLGLYVRLTTPGAQIALALVGFGAGLLAASILSGRRGDVVPALLLLGMSAIFYLSGRATRRQRLAMIGSGVVVTATVTQIASNLGGGDYRQRWSMRLAFTGPDGVERRTSHHSDFRHGLREGSAVELFYDPETPTDTTPEGERPRVEEHRWPLLALELPRGVRVGHDGRLRSPSLLRLAWLFAGLSIGLALPLSKIIRMRLS